MGLFGKKDEDKTKLELYLDYLIKFNSNSEVINYVREVIRKERTNPFITEENLMAVIENYIKNNYGFNLESYINSLAELFNEIYVSTSDFTNFEWLVQAYDEDIEEIFNSKLYHLFENEKSFYILMMNLRNSAENILELDSEKKIVSFMIDARSYFMSEAQFLAGMSAFLSKITYGINVDDLIKNTIEDLRKREGIYDISEDTLEEVHSKVMGADGFLKNLEDSVKKAEKLKTSLNDKINNYKTEIFQANQEGITRYKKELEKDITELQELLTKSKDELDKYIFTKMNETTESLTKETLESLKELREEKERILASLKGFEGTISTLALSKAAEISKTGNEQLTRLDEFVQNEPHLKEIIESMGVSSETLKAISELASQREIITPVPVEGASPLFVPSPNVIVPQNIIVDYTVNPFFDKTRSFESRIAEIKEKMEKNMEEKGVLYHSETLNIITAMLEELSPYLYGPSGGGKNMAVALIAELLNMPYINVGYINEEYQVIGAEPFLGNFKRSGIHECYQEGKIAFVDEFDNGNQRATIALNPFLRPSEDYFTFANMERVKRHPNFRMIAAGNTDGRGGTRNHATREAIEGSVLQRLTPFFIGYDENIESALLKSHPEWYEFILAFRRAQASWSGNEGELTLEDAVTTTDVANINRMLDDKAFTPEQIMAIEFVQAKSEDYLRAIEIYLKENYNASSKKVQDLLKAYEREAKKYSLKRGFRHE